jgi:hypothetical protein
VDETFIHTVVAEAEYDPGGPQQAQPPDVTFTVSTNVKLTEMKRQEKDDGQAQDSGSKRYPETGHDEEGEAQK